MQLRDLGHRIGAVTSREKLPVRRFTVIQKDFETASKSLSQLNLLFVSNINGVSRPSDPTNVTSRKPIPNGLRTLP